MNANAGGAMELITLQETQVQTSVTAEVKTQGFIYEYLQGFAKNF